MYLRLKTPRAACICDERPPRSVYLRLKIPRSWSILSALTLRVWVRRQSAAHGAFVRRASAVKPHLKTGLVCMHHSSRLSPILDLCPASQKLKPIFSSHLARVNMDFPKHHPMPLKEHVFPLFSRIEPAHLVTSSKLRQIQTGIKGKDLGIPTIRSWDTHN